MLRNFMDLITAVSIGGLLHISEESIQAYEFFLLRYLRGMKELYKEAVVKPNHHLAIHFAVFLRQFGPDHSWRAYGSERYNHLLQNMNTNNNIGMYVFINAHQHVMTLLTQVRWKAHSCDRLAALQTYAHFSAIPRYGETFPMFWKFLTKSLPRTNAGQELR